MRLNTSKHIEQPDLFSPTLVESRSAIQKQRQILSECVVEKLDLGSRLAELKMTHDSLRYTTERPPHNRGKYLTLENFRETASQIPILSFFSGAGGLDLGFEAVGFKHVAVVEHNEIFCSTLRKNRPKWTVIGPPESTGDVSDRRALNAALQKELGKKPFNGVLIGGPPCQPFSIAANQRFKKSGANFKRIGFAHKTHGNLLFDFLWFVERLQPRAFLIENVPGLLEIDGGQQVGRAIALLQKSGYTVSRPTILDAADYGVPQYRKRVFIIGSRNGKSFEFPAQQTGRVPCWAALRTPVDGLPNHLTRNHTAESVLRYMNLRYGERDQLGRVDRLDPDLPSKTVIAGGVSGGGRSHLHPTIPRTLSVRECARLQTFPDDYEFCGPPSRQFTQVGNAVPPVLAAQIASQIRRLLF